MKRYKHFLRLVITSVVCSAIFLLCTSIQGVEEMYEAQGEIAPPQYRTDTDRALDAQQQVTNHQLDQNEKNANDIQLQLQIIIEKLSSIESKLDDLTERVKNIEKEILPEEPEKEPVPPKPQPLSNEQK